MNYWLVKSEPSVYSWEKLIKDKKAVWDGVRNYAARNHLRAMKKNDLVLFYHSNEGLAIVGIAKVSKVAFDDPTADDSTWSAIEIVPFKSLNTAVTLSQLKKEKKLSEMKLLKIGRLSVSPVTADEYNLILELGK